MLLWLVQLADHFQIFNLFRYITFRSGAALATSAFIVFLFGPAMIGLLSGSWLSGRLAGVLSAQQTILRGYLIMGVAVVCNLLINLTIPPSLPWHILPLPLYTCISVCLYSSILVSLYACIQSQFCATADEQRHYINYVI